MTHTTTAGAIDRDELDPVAADIWHPIGATQYIAPGIAHQTTLLGSPLSYAIGDDGPIVWHSTPDAGSSSLCDLSAERISLPVKTEFGMLWTTLGSPADEIFPFDEFHEPDRHNVWVGGVGVHTSAPRIIENFLDMSHFPFVHPGFLGAEPHTEVADYQVSLARDGQEVVATECRFFQPMGALNALGGMVMDYVYRVPAPFSSILYKSSPEHDGRFDAIALFCQPVDDENTRAHMLLSMLDDNNDDRAFKRFQLLIFGQDKPIIENQRPKRLPLGSLAETPIRADQTSIAYRRWLDTLGLEFGVIRSNA